jgi:hypothetical protein
VVQSIKVPVMSALQYFEAVKVPILESDPPLATCHVASPRQKVLEDALVPLLSFETGRLPVTWLARLMLGVVQLMVVPFEVQKLLLVSVPILGSVSVMAHVPPVATQALLLQNCKTCEVLL